MDSPCVPPETRTGRDIGALINRQQHAREGAGVVALPAMFARMYQPANTGLHGGQTIDATSTKTLGAQHSAVTLVSDGANWQIVNVVGTVS